MALRKSITHMTDSGPTCPGCRASTVFGYGMTIESDVAFAQCGACHTVETFRVRVPPADVQQYRTLHAAHLDARATARVVPFYNPAFFSLE